MFVDQYFTSWAVFPAPKSFLLDEEFLADVHGAKEACFLKFDSIHDTFPRVKES